MAITEDRIGAHVAAKKAMTRSLVVRVSDELHGKLQHLAEKVGKKYGTKATISDIARAVLEEATTTRELPASSSLTFPNFDLDEAERMLEKGHSKIAVAKHFGMSAQTLSRYRRAGVGRRGSSEPEEKEGI
jgi:hypothetical protein